MAITDIISIPGSRSASQDSEGGVSYSVSLSILTDDQTDSPNFIGSNQPYTVGEIYDGWPITSIEIDETDDPCQWTMTLAYGSVDGEEEENPLDEPWIYSVNYEQHQTPVDYDIHQRPILNTAGDLFSEYMMADSARPTLTGNKNFASFPWSVANQFCNTINRDSVFGAPPETLKFERLSGQQQTTTFNGEPLTFFAVTVELTFNRDGWKRKVLNQGLREKKEGKLTTIKLNGKDITQPVLLDAQGQRAAEGAPPHVLSFDLYRSQNFAPLFN